MRSVCLSCLCKIRMGPTGRIRVKIICCSSFQRKQTKKVYMMGRKNVSLGDFTIVMSFPPRDGRKVRLIDLPIPIRSSDCIIRYNRLMSSSDFCIDRLYRSILSSDSFIHQSCFLVSSSDFCIGRLCWSVLSSDFSSTDPVSWF